MTSIPDARQPTRDTTAADGTIFTPYRVTQFFVVLASIVCVLLFWWAARTMGIPAERGFDAGVLEQPHWPLVLISIYVLFAVCLVVATLISGRWWFFGGLFAAVVGLSVLSARGGPIRDVLFDAQATDSPRNVFVRLALETCLLFIPIGLAWTFFWMRFDAALPAPDPDSRTEQMPLALALVAQTVITAAVVLLLAATDAKKQVMVSVFLGGLLGTALADYLAPHRKAAIWYWVGPLVVGMIGYLLAYVNAAAWTNGAPLGTFAALARPLPLDYASVGTAGALLGFWLAADRPRVRFSLRPASPSVDSKEPPASQQPQSPVQS